MVDPLSALLMTVSVLFLSDLMAALSAFVMLSPLLDVVCVIRLLIS